MNDQHGQFTTHSYSYSHDVKMRLRQLLADKNWRHSDAMVRALYLVSHHLNLGCLSANQRATTAVVVGSSRGPAQLLETTMAQFYREPTSAATSIRQPKLAARTSPSTTISAGSVALAHALKLGGDQFTLSSACTSSLQSLGIAYKLIQSGYWKHSLVGGAEDPLTPYIHTILTQAKVLVPRSDSGTIPLQAFGKTRTGMVPGQGAGLALLTHQSNYNPIAQILGYGATTEQAGIVGVTKNAQGLQTAIRLALADAQLTPNDIDIIATHGPGTSLGDDAELGAYRVIFGQCSSLPQLWITSWATGHTLGASGIIKVGLAIMALKHQRCHLPPYSLNRLTKSWTQAATNNFSKNTALITSMGFGGSSAALIIQSL